MLGMTIYSEKYYKNGTIFQRCVNSINYILDPEMKARRIINISEFADIFFIQAFWSLSERSKRNKKLKDDKFY